MCMMAENIINIVPRNFTDADIEDECITLDVEINNSSKPMGLFAGRLYLPEGMELDSWSREVNARTSYRSGGKKEALNAGGINSSPFTDEFGTYYLVSVYGDYDLNSSATSGVIGKFSIYIDTSVLEKNKVYPIYFRKVLLADTEGNDITFNEDANITTYVTYGDVSGVEEEIKVDGIVPSSVSESLSGETAKINLNLSNATGGVLNLSDAYGISEVSTTAKFEEVSYSRPTLAAKYGTICVPFDLASDTKVQYYTISEAAAGQITISKVASVPAGTPAIYENLGEGSISYSGTNVTLAAAGTDGAGAELVGTYVKTKVTDANTYYLKDGKFNRINGSFNSGAFKAYAKSGSALAKALEIFVDDADPTAINGASTSASIEGIYNAAGAQNKKLEKGVNILKMSDGSVKKVLVK